MDDLGNLAGLEEPRRSRLAPLRRLIVDTAAATPSIGPLAESIKWGEPSYTPQKRATGSSVRLALRKDGSLAMNFICHTGLVDRFRELYPDALQFEGNRSIVVDPGKPLEEDALRHCIALALTYFLQQR